MKAWVLEKIGDIKYEEIADPKPRRKEVLLRVKAAGICGSDIPRIYKTGAHKAPLVPGHEFAGTVVSVGEEVPEEWIGRNAGVFPLIPCMKCAPCMEERYEMCRSYDYLGSRSDGGFAEFVRVPEWNLLALPDNVSFEAAAMLEPMSVAMHAMRHGLHAISDRTLEKDETILISGLGTIGMLLLMHLRNDGYKNILLIGKKDFQRKKAIELGAGADSYFDYKTGDPYEWVMDKTHSKGVSLMFDCVGRNEVINLGIRCAKPGGALVFVGNPYSDMGLEKDVYWKILRNQLTIKGTWNSSFTHSKEDDWNHCLRNLENGSIHPERFISHRFKMEELEKGFMIMRDKTEDFMKVMAVQ
ncbi:MAG: galactitol-1-phosphate 5-dehydrogenase [Lachnospiraceae bacterium]|nr:galactitol-1-phosphate 5-dehydrogenase [Lachnospiraceae bacterium]